MPRCEGVACTSESYPPAMRLMPHSHAQHQPPLPHQLRLMTRAVTRIGSKLMPRVSKRSSQVFVKASQAVVRI